MSTYYDEIEIEDFTLDAEQGLYTYPCPCGDKFVISKDDLASGEEVARCPSCSLLIRVIYDPEDFVEGKDTLDTAGNLPELPAEIVA